MAKKHYNITAIIRDRRGNILSIGKNSYCKTHPMQARLAKQLGMEHRQYLHAEIASILRCRRLDKAHSISVYRFDSDGKEACAKPCPICMQAIREAGIKIVEHT